MISTGYNLSDSENTTAFVLYADIRIVSIRFPHAV